MPPGVSGRPPVGRPRCRCGAVMRVLVRMQRPILVTGGTGTLGRVLVQQLLDNGLRPKDSQSS